MGENHRQAHMTLMARKICDVFATFSRNFGPPTYFISYYSSGRALHAVLYRREFFFKKKKRRAELFDYGVATVVSNVTQMLHGAHGDDTTNVYVLLVRFALAHLKI